jgi:hypothetical protein
MNKFICLAVVSTFYIGTCGAAQPQQRTDEEVCKINVDTTVEYLAYQQKRSGRKEVAQTSGLSIADINKIVAEKGVCAASQAIYTNKKTVEADK